MDVEDAAHTNRPHDGLDWALRYSLLVVTTSVSISVLTLTTMTVLAARTRVAPPPEPAQVQACDRQVATLMTSHDALEVQRADILVHALNCAVAKRL